MKFVEESQTLTLTPDYETLPHDEFMETIKKSIRDLKNQTNIPTMWFCDCHHEPHPTYGALFIHCMRHMESVNAVLHRR